MMKNVMYIVKKKKVIVRGGITSMTEGMRDWKVLFRSNEARHIYIRADSEEGALSIAQSLPIKDWTDDEDERGESAYTVEEDE